MKTYDYDSTSGDESLVNYGLSITFYRASASWSTFTSTVSGTGAYFQWRYRFTCNSYYYGDLCNVYCKARDDQYGHYTCSSSGSKICRSGWTGTDCKYGKKLLHYPTLITKILLCRLYYIFSGPVLISVPIFYLYHRSTARDLFRYSWPSTLLVGTCLSRHIFVQNL